MQIYEFEVQEVSYKGSSAIKYFPNLKWAGKGCIVFGGAMGESIFYFCLSNF